MDDKTSVLDQAVALGHRDRKVFDWPNAESAFEKLSEEVLELKEAMEKKDKKEIFAEFSDVFLTLLQVARHLDIDPSKNLKFAMDKYNLRYEKMSSLIKQDQRFIEGLNFDELEKYWQKAKKSTKTELETLVSTHFF